MTAKLSGASWATPDPLPIGTPTADGHAATRLSAAILTLVTKNSDYTFVLTDAPRKLYASNASGSVTFTVPPNSSVAFPVGTVIDLARYGSGAMAVAAGAGVTIRSKGGLLTLAGQYSTARLVKLLADEWLLSGDLA